MLFAVVIIMVIEVERATALAGHATLMITGELESRLPQILPTVADFFSFPRTDSTQSYQHGFF